MNEPTPAGALVEAPSGPMGAVTELDLIDNAVATAKKWPRDVSTFLKRCRVMIEDPEIAKQCNYALTKGGQHIEGASVRLAEIAAAEWGNLWIGARPLEPTRSYIEAQGMVRDLERNTTVQVTCRRSIMGKNGRYGQDMIATTANAAVAIAYRNAIFKVLPKAFVETLRLEALKIATGGSDVETVAKRRAKAIQVFETLGVRKDQIFKALGVEKLTEIKADEVGKLHGWWVAIQEGAESIDSIFADAEVGSGYEDDEKAPQSAADKLAGRKEQREAEGSTGAARRPEDAKSRAGGLDLGDGLSEEALAGAKEITEAGGSVALPAADKREIHDTPDGKPSK